MKCLSIHQLTGYQIISSTISTCHQNEYNIHPNDITMSHTIYRILLLFYISIFKLNKSIRLFMIPLVAQLVYWQIVIR